MSITGQFPLSTFAPKIRFPPAAQRFTYFLQSADRIDVVRSCIETGLTAGWGKERFRKVGGQWRNFGLW
jgi:hypothetical protein